MPELAIGLAVAQEFKAVEREPGTVFHQLHVPFTGLRFVHAVGLPVPDIGLTRQADSGTRPHGPKADVGDVPLRANFDQRYPMSQARMDIAVVDDTSQQQLHIEPQLREHGKEEPVVFETIAAAPVFDNALEERGQTKRQVEGIKVVLCNRRSFHFHLYVMCDVTAQFSRQAARVQPGAGIGNCFARGPIDGETRK